ncbi:MAG TPA: hypothetical protein VGC97_16420 [Pyrinomonadaceae bacterium]|jgi:hypothetical protein
MVEHLTESDSKAKKMSVEFRTIYSITIILTCFGLVFLITPMQPLIYVLYEYDPHIIGTSGVEEFQAVKETYPIIIMFFYFVTSITVLCSILSFIALFQRMYLKSYFITLMIFIFSALLTLFYWFIWLVSKTSSAGVLG